MTDPETIRHLEALAAAYRQMPNGGATLQLTVDGRQLSNGLVVVARFQSRRDAAGALQAAGFTARGVPRGSTVTNWRLSARA